MKTGRQRAERDNMDRYLFSVFDMSRLIESSLQKRWAEQIHLAKNPSQVERAPSKDTQWQRAVRLTPDVRVEEGS